MLADIYVCECVALLLLEIHLLFVYPFSKPQEKFFTTW